MEEEKHPFLRVLFYLIMNYEEMHRSLSKERIFYYRFIVFLLDISLEKSSLRLCTTKLQSK